MDSLDNSNPNDSVKDEYSTGKVQGACSQRMNLSSSSTSGYLSGQEDDVVGRAGDKERAADSIFSSDNPFFSSENAVAISTVEELSSAVERCKLKVLESPECSEERKWLVRNLIELQIILQEKKDLEGTERRTNSTNLSHIKMRVVFGHHFVLQKQINAKNYCERCSGVIWGMVHSWYQCRDCSYCCHLKCLNQVYRMCAHIKASEEPLYQLRICPEVGLSVQSYKCAECRSAINFDNWVEPRRCDYDGKYYCHSCHWNALSVIPARVIHNWDFEERKICQASKQFLTLMAKRPVLKLQELNPMLFNFVDELILVKKIRDDILIMKKYFISCKEAIENRMLWKLQDRQHFTENADAYSMQDLIDIHSGVLLEYLQNIYTSFEKHIREDCKLCYAKGYICELCQEKTILFPFEAAAISCQKCQSVYHKFCWTKKSQQCPKCERVLKRSQVMMLEDLSLEES